MSLPAADDLFRPTSPDDADAEGSPSDAEAAAPHGKPVVSAVRQHHGRDDGGDVGSQDDTAGTHAATDKRAQQRRRSSGRVRHDEKMTVYVTAEELLDLEHARLALRRDHGIAVDRGRLVREALAIVLADLEHHADDSDLVKRLEA